MAVILSSYSAIILGGILVAAGVFAHQRQHAAGRYLLAVGGVLIVLGIVGLVWFLQAFG